jgi:hypothetical protein
MSELFVHLYLDEDVHVLVAELVRAQEFAATTTLEAGNIAHPDEAQLAYAADHGMAILTHNRNDFQTLANAFFTQGRQHAGIIIAVRRSPYELAARLTALMNAMTADEMVNQIVYI